MVKNARVLFQWAGIALLLLLGTGSYLWYRASAGITTNKTPIPSEMSASGLVGYWTFDGADYSSSTVITDKSGNSHSGTLTNAPTKTTGKWGQALDFPGTNQYVSVGAVYNGVKTVAFWIWADNTTKNIIDLNATATIDVSSGTVRGNNFTSPTIYIDGIASSTPTIDTTGWHFVAITTGTGINASAVDIGRISTGYFDGRLDDVRMYSSELSASAVYQLYTVGSAEVNAPPEDTLSQSLRGYWKLDDGSGTNATDSSGNANTLAMTGSPSWVTGNIGPYALDFSGSGQYLSIASPSSSLDFADGASFTITGWFNRDTFANDHTILSTKSGQSTESDGYIAYIDDATDQLIIRFDENGTTDARTFTSTSTFTATGWHHFALSWNESAPDAILYIDGKPDGSGSGTAFASMGNLANANAFYIGAETDAGNPFDGKLDDIRIYGYALSADQVKKIYNTTSPTQPVDTSLVGHWTFDGPDIQGTTAIDRSSFGNNGSITGTTKTIGKLGQALSFNGTSDYITISNESSFDFDEGQSVTVTGWFNRKNITSADTLFGKRNGAPSGVYMFLYDNNVSLSYSEVGDPDGDACFLSVYLGTALNTWEHFALVWSADHTLTVYANGVQRGQNSSCSTVSGASTDVPLLLGAEYNGTNKFDGNLDDFRFYNRALSPDEILKLYAIGR